MWTLSLALLTLLTPISGSDLDFLSALDPPTGVGRCCIVPGTGCLGDKHCVDACIEGGDPDVCKNCMCWNQGTGCCQEDYVCSSKTPVTPGSGTCSPYCNPTDPTTGEICGDHGNCTKPLTCSCDAGFSPTSQCTTCDDQHYGESCNACPMDSAGDVCSGHGMCDGAGTLSGTGTCACDRGWADDADRGSCNVCATGYGPAGKCDTFVCTQGCGVHGNCTSPDVCTCDTGWSGLTCDTTSCADITPEGLPDCSGNGKCTAPDVCTCKEGYQGRGCEISKAACCATTSCSNNPKQCNSCCQYPPSHPGVCTNPGYQCKGCDCGVSDGKGTQGCCTNSYCQEKPTYQHDELKVEGEESSSHHQQTIRAKHARRAFLATLLRGTAPPAPLYQCCPVNKAGKDCQDCAPGYYGAQCKPCPGGTPSGTNQDTCSGHGICVDNGAKAGTCSCAHGYSGMSCDVCNPNQFHCPTSVPGTVCSGRGMCQCPPSALFNVSTNSTLGSCSCERGYDGQTCSMCGDGYWMSSSLTCTKCDGCSLCNKKTGQCSTTPSPGPNPSPLSPSSVSPYTPPGVPILVILKYVLYGVCGALFLLFCWWRFKKCKGKKSNNSSGGSSSTYLWTQTSPMLQAAQETGAVPPRDNTSISFQYAPPSITGGTQSSEDFPDLPEFPDLPGMK